MSFLSKSTLGLATLMITTFAQAQNSPISRFETLTSSHLPKDGSSCDPSVIEANLKALKKANVLKATELTETNIRVSGFCYNLPCPNEIHAAIAVHCQKAESLSQIVDLLR